MNKQTSIKRRSIVAVGLVLSGLLAAGVLVLVFVVALGGSPVSAAPPISIQSATATPTAAVAQNQAAEAANTITNTVSADPANDLTSASIDLHAGYIMDPYLLPVVGKAERAATDVLKGCNGFVSAAPNVVVNWSGMTDQLNFFVYGDDDAVLVVQRPDGSFVCNDDAGPRTINPLVTLKIPEPGAYKVHIGSANQNRPALGFLAITQAKLDDARLAALDLTPMLRRRERPKVQALPQLDPKALLTGRAPIFGSAELWAGFKPVQTYVAGGGDIAAIRMKDQKLACAGYISAVPSYSFTWSGAPQGLRLFLEALKDSSLAVVTPDQKVLCGMNSATDNLNPVVDIDSPGPGQYQVYVAAMEPDIVVGGRLTITGDRKAAPATLAPVSQ